MKMPARRRLLALAGGLACSGLARAAALPGDPLLVPAPKRRVDRPALLLDLAWAGPRLLAVGEAGLVLYSDDEGRRWRQAAVPVSVTLTAVSFADAQRGWAVGHSGVVLRSTDGGMTWHKQLDGIGVGTIVLRDATAAGAPAWIRLAEQGLTDGADKAFFDVHVAANGRGLLVGAYGLALSTADAGEHWQAVAPLDLPNPKGRHLYAIAAHGEGLFLAGEQGLLLASVGRQGAFVPLTSPYVGSFFGLLAGPGDQLFAYGLRGHAFRSDDRGRRWHPVELGAAGSLMAGGRLRDGRVLLADETGKLLLGDAAGQRFSALSLPQAAYVSAWTEAPDGSVVLAGARGTTRMAPIASAAKS